MEVIEVIEASVQTNKRLLFLCTTPNKDPIRIICLNQPLLLRCCHNTYQCQTSVTLWILLGGCCDVVKLLPLVNESSVCFDFNDLCFWATDSPRQIREHEITPDNLKINC